MNKRMLAVVSLSLFIYGCDGEPKLDGSSDDTMKDSMTKMLDSVGTESDRDQLKQSIKVIWTDNLDIQSLGDLAKLDPQQKASEMRSELNGLTAEQINQKAAVILAERQEKEKTQALRDIAGLQAKAEKASSDAEKLKAFKIDDAKFYWQDREYGMGEPVIDITVTNGTDSAVSRAYFEGTVASPDRSVPWIQEAFNYEISGGIEPGETLHWKLAPNRFGAWGKDTPDDAILTVKVLRLDGPDGKELWDAEGLSDREKERLETLKAKYQ
ncbi:hypothetical protein QO259_18135 [Salinicola sp. JS01]|uniref:DUF6694 family lipoprotein n=1 Tax=Salinicola sp. JS01 TaxID=3050071 RepID=UPI00255B8D5B|nr:DUF6694 family lipoprotein [Salinicola sp. JS01]WIX32701.1 hypothetical protein QO259_18135 [Salinicola sp. JS01]